MFAESSPASDLSAEPWQRFREQMPVAQKWAYFDHAAVAPLPAPSQQAIAHWVEQAAQEGDTVWPIWSRQVEKARALGAQLIGAEPEEVALVRSTTEGISLVAEGFPWRAGDNVVTLANEFPSNLYPWMNLAARGVETRRVPVDDGRVELDRLAAACDSRTRIISVSWVGFLSGWRLDLDRVVELARGREALVFVDAIQGLGVFPLDVRATPIDFLAADGHKWLLGPEGAGLFYLRREHLDLLRPVGVGWHSVVHATDYSHIELALKPSAQRYEGGTQNMVGFIGLARSLQLLLDFGTANVGRRVLEIADLACERLREVGGVVVSPHDGPHRSGIVAFELPGHDAAQVRQRALAAGVVLSARSGKLRIAPHVYTSSADVERLISVLVA